MCSCTPYRVKQNRTEKDVLLQHHNEQRLAADLLSFEIHESLGKAAQKHADWMAKNNRLDHTGENGSSILDRVKNKKWRFIGENIARGQINAKQAVDDWMSSQGHRDNILNPNFKYIGFGISGDDRLFWCVVFSD